MTYCEFCGEQISFLPFKCKYCGGAFCKEHRLPEYHQCSFELKSIPITPSKRNESSSRSSRVRGPSRNFKKYMKRQDKEKKKDVKFYLKYPTNRKQFQGIKLLLLLIVIFSILAIIFNVYNIKEYLFLSLNALVYKFTFHTIITSLFIYQINPFDSFFFFSIILLSIMFYFAYIMGKLIESVFGKKFLLKLFLFSGFISILFYLLLRVALIYYLPIVDIIYYDGVGLVWGGLFGLFTFTIFPAMNQKLTAFLTIIPVRMRGKSFLIIIILFRLIPGLFYGLVYSPVYFLFYIPELGGVLGSYLVYKYNLFRS
ncbi:MAG: AN1-type zinc finger protein [Candidatus Hermodarchaeota archaeon]